MSHKIKIYILSMGLILFGGMQLAIVGSGAFFGSSVLAACDPKVDPGNPECKGASGGGSTPAGTDTAPASCSDQSVKDGDKAGTASDAAIADCLKQNKIIVDLNIFVNVLAAAVGIAVVGSLIAGGIQYSLAGGNANSTQAAKGRITNAVIALFAFIFMYAFLQWLIPGGL